VASYSQGAVRCSCCYSVVFVFRVRPLLLVLCCVLDLDLETCPSIGSSFQSSSRPQYVDGSLSRSEWMPRDAYATEMCEKGAGTLLNGTLGLSSPSKHSTDPLAGLTPLVWS
jgi:hypothetical protein